MPGTRPGMTAEERLQPPLPRHPGRRRSRRAGIGEPPIQRSKTLAGARVPRSRIIAFAISGMTRERFVFCCHPSVVNTGLVPRLPRPPLNWTAAEQVRHDLRGDGQVEDQSPVPAEPDGSGSDLVASRFPHRSPGKDRRVAPFCRQLWRCENARDPVQASLISTGTARLSVWPTGDVPVTFSCRASSASADASLSMFTFTLISPNPALPSFRPRNV